MYVTAVEALRKKERQDETQFTTKIGGVISFCKNFHCHYTFDGLLCGNWPFSPPNLLNFTNNFIELE